jgi:hypothetical protein
MNFNLSYQSNLNYQSNSNNIMQNITLIPGSQLTMKKTKSSSNSNISDIEKNIIQNIL